MVRRASLACLLLALVAADLPAQFFPGNPIITPGVPVLVPNGIGFQYRGNRLRVSGFFGAGYSLGVVPATGFFPVPVVPIVPIAPIPTVGFVDSRVNIQVIAPVVTLPPRPVFGYDPRVIDLSGVDLDREPAPLLALERKLPPRPPDAPRPKMDPPAAEKAPVRPKEEKPLPKIEKPPEPPRTLTAEGLEAFREGEFGLAALLFRQAALAEPGLARPRFLLAHAYFAQGRFREAVEAIEAGLKLDPDFPTHDFRPRVELYKGIEAEYARQRKALDDAAAERPDRADFHFLTGFLDWFEGRRADAARSFNRARPLLAEPWYADRFLKAGV